MAMGEPACWICGAVADSAEHMVKASDVRANLPGLTHRRPAFRHTKHQRNIPVRGAQAPILKFKPSICQHCNNARSQPWDRAWETLERGVREARPQLREGDRIPLGRIFPVNRQQAMLNVHLFLTKMFGCVAVENSIPVPIESFARHLMNGTPDPSIRLVFVHIPPGSTKIKIQVGHVNVRNDNQTGHTATAVWHYIVGTLGVAVSFAKPGLHQLRFTTNLGWHPDDVNRTWTLR